jgi:fructuronate reductase
VKLTNAGLSDKALREQAGFILPQFDREEMIENTKNNPEWVHFGAGNIFRALHAHAAQKLLDSGDINTGIIAVEHFDIDIIKKIYRLHDNLSIAISIKADGSMERTLIGSVAESLCFDEDYSRLEKIFSNPSLKIITFTITEKGYMLSDFWVRFSKLLYKRYQSGEYPLALVSTDNCRGNGDILKKLIMSMSDGDFARYIDEKISFPLTMIDKITPRPDPHIEEMLETFGLENIKAITTEKNSFIAPFVNAENSEYLVIEDNFPNGRPPLEHAGVLFADRKTVEAAERMKVCTCLNPLHTALAIFGCLLSYSKISDEIKDLDLLTDLLTLIKRIGYKEGMAVVTDPGIISPREFLDTVINERLPNPFIPDSPQRIACDTSQKLSIRFGETIKAYIAQGLDLNELEGVSLTLAGWLRYLSGIDDNGEAFTPSPDPLLKKSQADLAESPEKLLSNAEIFGINLCETKLFKKILMYYNCLSGGKGAVRQTLSDFAKNFGGIV